MNVDPTAIEKLKDLFFPYANERIRAAKSEDTKFVHYTSAYVALQIMEKQEVWMRNAVVMNDFSEIQHGQRCLSAAWHDESIGGKMRYLLESVEAGLWDRLAGEFNQQHYDRAAHSFLTAISEHGDKSGFDDRFGRLSMWRAYGGDTNVALVLNNRPFLSESTALNAYTSPVLYCDEEIFKTEFARVVRNIEDHIEYVKVVGSDLLVQFLRLALHFAVLSAKHPGFSEEREWRVIYSPTIIPSNKIASEIVSVEGVPQVIHKIPLKNYPEEGFVGATLPELLEEVIIGPTQHPWPIYDALARSLERAGVAEASSKVRVSNIPLRR